MAYDVELENTLNKMKDNTGFFKPHYDSQKGWMLNNHPIKTPGGSNIKINENEYNKVFKKYLLIQNMNLVNQ